MKLNITHWNLNLTLMKIAYCPFNHHHVNKNLTLVKSSVFPDSSVLLPTAMNSSKSILLSLSLSSFFRSSLNL